MNMPSGSGLFEGNAIEVHSHEIIRRGGGDLGRGSNHAGRSRRGQAFYEPIQFWILVRRARQGHLAGERILKLSSQGQPLLRRSWREIAEGTHDFLPRSFRSEDGLDQKVIYVCSIFISTNRFSDVHGHYR